MNSEQPEWIASAFGQPPTQYWSRPLEGGLTHLVASWETEESLVADDAGGLYVFDRAGTLRHMTRGYPHVRAVAISADGERALVAFEDRNLACFDRQLRLKWTKTLYDTILEVALDPFGRHMAVSLAGRRLHIMTTSRREIAELETQRPIRFLRFAMTHPYLVAAAEDGLLAGIEFLGRVDWEERLFATAGDMAINGNASMILLTGFAHGLQRYNGQGRNRGTFVVEGSPARLATSFSGEQIATATLEGQLYRLDRKGNLTWATAIPEEIPAICLSATGDALTVGLASGRVVRLDWRAPPDGEGGTGRRGEGENW